MKAVLEGIIALALIAAPSAALAAVRFSEIMYDLPSPGSDTGREWIEIRNEGSAVDLNDWRLFEGDTNHKLSTTTLTTAFSLPAGSVAVIADDPATFLADWPAFTGFLFGSSFSLSNTGEGLVLRDAELADVDSVTYASSWGAAGDGLSLQFSAGSWTAAAPTPGTAPAAPESSGGVSQESGSAQAPSPQAGGGTPLPLPAIRASAGGDRSLIVGADAIFEGRAFAEDGSSLPNARFVWNFGNGAVREGKKVLHHYDYPGTYVVMLAVASGELSATARITVSAGAADVGIASVTPAHVSVFNKEPGDVDLSRWIIRSGTADFILPEGTILARQSEVAFPNSVTGLATDVPALVSLRYPNGTEVPAAAGRQEASSGKKAVPPAPTPVSAPPPAASLSEKPDNPATSSSAVPVNAAATLSSFASFAYAPQGPWLIALLVLVLVPAGALLLLRLRGSTEKGFTIIEE